ncbi:MAG TPA: hypothetical protein VH306_02405 [Gaiellaceae bacterium]|jgi:hypothetical protein
MSTGKHLSRDAIVRWLHDHGRHEDAVRADRELPERLQEARDVELLGRFGIDPADLEGETFRDVPPRDD